MRRASDAAIEWRSRSRLDSVSARLRNRVQTSVATASGQWKNLPVPVSVVRMRVKPEVGGSVMRDGMVHRYTCDTRSNAVRSARSHLDLAAGGRHWGCDQVVHGGVSDGTHVRGGRDAVQEERTGVEMVSAAYDGVGNGSPTWRLLWVGSG